MTMLVTLEDARAHLRIEDGDSSGDPDLELKIAGASRAVLNYCDADQDWLDSGGDPLSDSSGLLVPDDVRCATLLLLGILFRDRDEEGESAKWDHGFLPRPVLSLLYSYRTPTAV